MLANASNMPNFFVFFVCVHLSHLNVSIIKQNLIQDKHNQSKYKMHFLKLFHLLSGEKPTQTCLFLCEKLFAL